MKNTPNQQIENIGRVASGPTLSEKQKIAAQKYVFEGYNKKQALIDAGYGKHYVNSNLGKLFNSPAMNSYISELQQRREDEAAELWRVMSEDAPEIYRRYKALAEKTDSDDVKRRIYSDILNRTGYVGANKLEVTKKIDPKEVEEDLEKVLKDLKDEGVDISQYIDGESD